MKERRIYVREMRERRALVRIGIEQAVELHGRDGGVLEAEGINLSEQGLLCASTDSIGRRSRVVVMFRLPILHEEYEVRIDARAIRKGRVEDRNTVAVEFVDLNPADLTAIQAFIRNFVEEEEKRRASESKAGS